MKISKSQIKKIESFLKELEPRYEWLGVQFEEEPWIIVEMKNGDYGRRIDSESIEGKKLIEENRVKYPKGHPVLILDGKWD